MPKSIDIGSLFLSWGDDLQQEDQAFYGVAFTVRPFCWVFLGLSVDRLGNPYSESHKEWGVLEVAQGKRLIPCTRSTS